MVFIYFFLAVFLQFLIVNTNAVASDSEAYKYITTVGDSSEEVRWCIEKSNTIQMLYSTKNEVSITHTDQALATIQWKKKNSTQKTAINVQRRGDEIHIKGTFNGSPIDTKVAIDETPWYQATTWSLRNFVLSKDTSKVFWTIRATSLKPYKVVATKLGEETLEGKSGENQAIKVELRIQGLLSHFWKSHYWFRKSDGVFLRFEGVTGLPGSPLAIVRYQGKMPPCSANVASHGKHNNQALSNAGDI